MKSYDITRRIGIALFMGGKEIFIEVAMGGVEIEKIVRKRLIKAPKAGVKVFRFD